MGYYNQYLFENCITWTTDGAYAGTFRYRPGKFYCTNVCGVLTGNPDYSNTCLAELINLVAQRHVSRGGNPKLMNNVVAEIELDIPVTADEQQKISKLLEEYTKLLSTQLTMMEYVERERATTERIAQSILRDLGEAH